jgi:hypothetical protein
MFAPYRFKRCTFDENLRRICLQAEVFGCFNSRCGRLKVGQATRAKLRARVP